MNFIQRLIKKVTNYLWNTCTLSHIPKKSSEIYQFVFAHRGFHHVLPENTIASYLEAIKHKFAIEMDIRILRCGTIVCFHDRYMKRLLGVPGILSKKRYHEIMDYNVQGSNEKVPTLKEALWKINSKVPILIEIKGTFSNDFQENLKEELSGYEGKVYFHAKNIFAYNRAKKIWGDKVFFILNVFRKRFDFLKGYHYADLPSVPRIADLIIEAEDNAASVIRKMWYLARKYTSRIDSNHFLISYKGKKNQICHRAIVDSNLPEHSIIAFKKCIDKDKAAEFDIVSHKAKIKVYHFDGISSKLGQPKSSAEKLKIDNSPELHQVLKVVGGKIPLIIDIKDLRIFSRKFEDQLITELKNYDGEYVVQSFNPLVLIYFKKKMPEVIRGQVGHSLVGLRKLKYFLFPIVNFLLFYYGDPDYVVYDLNENVQVLSRFNKISGLPVIGYAPKSKEETISYDAFFDNYIVEGDWEN